MPRLITLAVFLFLAACGSRDDAPAEPAGEATADESPPSLASYLDAQPDEVKARYPHRHPLETLQFFEIEPGMTVVEGLPGGGWYSRLLLNYLGPDGRLIGINYSMDMWPLFPFANEEFLARMENWIEGYRTQMQEVTTEDSAALDAFYFGSMPESLAGTADVVFFPRVLHNLANFQNNGKGQFLDIALADAYAILKPGGIFGVVQHEAREDRPDAFADGSRGYLKKAWVIEQVEAAGFEFVAESDVNQNPLDQPGDDDIVWRLPPNYVGTGEDAELKAAVDAIGESNRMTLKFRKPE